MSLVPSRTPSRVIPGLWQGGFLSGESGRDLARTFGLVVFCAAEHQPKERDFPGMRILRVPLIDDPKRPLSGVEARAAINAGHEVASMVAIGRRALVTCAMGLNRSGLVTALALRTFYPASQCILLVRQARGPWALSNPQFVRFLKSYSP